MCDIIKFTLNYNKTSSAISSTCATTTIPLLPRSTRSTAITDICCSRQTTCIPRDSASAGSEATTIDRVRFWLLIIRVWFMRSFVGRLTVVDSWPNTPQQDHQSNVHVCVVVFTRGHSFTGHRTEGESILYTSDHPHMSLPCPPTEANPVTETAELLLFNWEISWLAI